MSTESESFTLLKCLDGTKFVFFSVFSLKETICGKKWSNTRPKIAKTPHPVEVCAWLKKYRMCLKTSFYNY